MSIPLPKEEFSDLFNSFEHSAFRLETLDAYTVPSEAAEYSRFRAGEEIPLVTETDWTKLVRRKVGEGKVMQRVHMISTPLTPYLKYEIHWGYVYNHLAGEAIHLIDRANVQPEIGRATDFWLFDEETLILMRYDAGGRFLHAEREDSREALMMYSNMRDSLLSSALTLKNFLSQVRSS